MTQTVATQQRASSRLRTLDGLRGFFLVFMVIIHLNYQLKTTLGKLNHHYFGWVEDAQGFVFISGLVVGLVYGGILLRKSAPAMLTALAKRCRTIFSYQALLIVAAGLVIVFLGNIVTSSLFDDYRQNPFAYTAIALTMISVPSNMGILPMYLLFMAATPYVLMQFERGRFLYVAMLSAFFWTIAQTHIMTYWAELLETAVSQNFGFNLRIGLFFDLFAWQVIYFLGLFFGFKLAKGDLDLAFLQGSAARHAFLFALGLAFILGLWDRVIFDHWISREFSESFLDAHPRQHFSSIYVANFAVDLFAVTWLLLVGRFEGSTLIGMAGRFLHWLFNWKPLVFLGNHSLQVFAFHIVLQYILAAVLSDRAVGEFYGSLLIVASVMLLFVPAYIHAGYQRRQRLRLAVA